MNKICKLIIIVFSFYMFTSCESCKEGKLNSKNSEKLEAGMSVDSLINIMGKPLRIVAGNQYLTYPEEYNVYVYYNACGTSDNINIVLDTNERIVDIVSVD